MAAAEPAVDKALGLLVALTTKPAYRRLLVALRGHFAAGSAVHAAAACMLLDLCTGPALAGERRRRPQLSHISTGDPYPKLLMVGRVSGAGAPGLLSAVVARVDDGEMHGHWPTATSTGRLCPRGNPAICMHR